MVTKQEIRKTLYAMGRSLGISSDELHALVYGVTHKEHISELSDREFFSVRAEMMNRMKGLPPEPEEYKHEPKQKYIGGMGDLSEAQAKYIWKLMYKLESLDTEPCEFTVRERLAAVIRKELGVTVVEGVNGNKIDIFGNVDADGASKLIEQIKRYIASAERKVKRRAAGE